MPNCVYKSNEAAQMMAPIMLECPALFVNPTPTRVSRCGVQVVGLLVAHRAVCCIWTGGGTRSSLSAYFIPSARLLFLFFFLSLFFFVGINFNHDFRTDFGIQEQVLLWDL